MPNLVGQNPITFLTFGLSESVNPLVLDIQATDVIISPLMEESNWKSIGWFITRKLIYYVFTSAVLWMAATYAFSLMTVASTLSVIVGAVLLVATVGVFLTLVVREFFNF